MRNWQERREARVLSFRQCPTCTYDLATGEGERNCHYGACPGLPEELDVLCPRCNFNFFTREGTPGCGEGETCEFALEAPEKVAMMRRWLAHA
jgi:hypothetical protein